MKQLFLSLAALLLTTVASAENRTYRPEVKSLQAVVNQDWLSPTVMRLNGNDVLYIGFDELSHDYHRYVYRLEHCEADRTTSEELFESDWHEGFNNNVIEHYERSINTTVPYTHYQLQIPNDRCRLRLSGNYRLHIAEDGEDEDIAHCSNLSGVEHLDPACAFVQVELESDAIIEREHPAILGNDDQVHGVGALEHFAQGSDMDSLSH